MNVRIRRIYDLVFTQSELMLAMPMCEVLNLLASFESDLNLRIIYQCHATGTLMRIPAHSLGSVADSGCNDDNCSKGRGYHCDPIHPASGNYGKDDQITDNRSRSGNNGDRQEIQRQARPRFALTKP